MLTRKELYAEVKNLGLEEVIKEKAGKNFTQVSNEMLSAFIDSAKDTPDTPAVSEKSLSKVEASLIRLLAVLSTKKVIGDSDCEYILK